MFSWPACCNSWLFLFEFDQICKKRSAMIFRVPSPISNLPIPSYVSFTGVFLRTRAHREGQAGVARSAGRYFAPRRRRRHAPPPSASRPVIRVASRPGGRLPGEDRLGESSVGRDEEDLTTRFVVGLPRMRAEAGSGHVLMFCSTDENLVWQYWGLRGNRRLARFFAKRRRCSCCEKTSSRGCLRATKSDCCLIIIAELR